MRTKKKDTYLKKLFSKYSKQKQYLTKNDMKRFLKKEYHIQYNNHIMTSCMEIWGSRKSKTQKKLIFYDNFRNMYQMPDGFLRQFSVY